MRTLWILPLLLALLAGTVLADNFQVMVQDTGVEPPVLMKGDTGVIHIQVVNTGESGVQINRAYLFGGSFSVTSDPYPTVGWLGAGNSMEFTFTVEAGSEEGIFYPRFVLEYSDGTTLRYAIPVEVDDTGLALALVERPDYVALGKSTRYDLRIGNPRPNSVKGVQVFAEGDGFESAPTSVFVGTLGSDEESAVAFNITPDRVTQARFRVLYRNGINEHQSLLTVPVLPSDNKKAPDPLISNVQISQTGEVYHLSGDVSNAGLRPAKSVVLRTDTPAVPTDPYRIYVVGSLDPDDFSSFELSFTLPVSGTVPLIVEYKDEDGNRFTSETGVEVDVAPTSDPATPLSWFGTLLVGLIVVVIGAAIVYSWRRR